MYLSFESEVAGGEKGVGGLAHGRADDSRLISREIMLLDELGHVCHSLRRSQRGSAELHNDSFDIFRGRDGNISANRGEVNGGRGEGDSRNHPYVVESIFKYIFSYYMRIYRV